MPPNECPPITLDQAWENCLSMWRFVVEQLETRTDYDVIYFKHLWLKKQGIPYDQEPQAACWFCEYQAQQRHAKAEIPEHTLESLCPLCPGCLVDPLFCCEGHSSYDWLVKPKEFLAEIERLFLLYKQQQQSEGAQA